MAGRRALLTTLLLIACGSSREAETPASQPSPRSSSSSSARPVPALSVRNLDRSETQLTKAIAGRPALVTLWATWCEACREEMPALNKLDAWAKEHGAVVIGVAVGEELAQVSSYASSHRMPYPILVDEQFSFADALGEKRVPTTLVINREGQIVYTGGTLDDRALSAFHEVLSK